MLPRVTEYLKTHTFRQLEEEHGVLARPSRGFDKFSLNYDQIMVKNGDPLAEECRGLIVRPNSTFTFLADRGEEWKDREVGHVTVLAWPMNRFYNMGDSAGAEVNWGDPNLRVYEKLDGTMIVTYWDPDKERWFAATRAVPEADLPIRLGDMEAGDMTFSDLFFTALKATREAMSGTPITWPVHGFEHVVHLNKELTYVFELTSPINRVVVRYDEPRVTLLAARHAATGKEVAIESLNVPWVPRPKVWELHEPSAIAAFVDAADPSSLEGAVVCDSQFRRLKVKNKSWVLSSRAKDLVTVSRRSALEAIIAGTVDDVIPLVAADVATELTKMQDELRTYLKRVDDRFTSWRVEAQGDRKRFAQLVVASKDWTTPYFQLLDGKGEHAWAWAQEAQSAGKLSPKMLDTMLEEMRRG